MSGTLTDGDSDSDERWYLADERDFLVRSLHDAALEHDAGDLSDDDYRVLTERDTTRLAEVDAALAKLGPGTGPAAPTQQPAGDSIPSSEWRRVAAIAICFLAVAAAVILVERAVNPRLPGQASSGTVTLSTQQLIEQQLAQATSLNNGGQVVPALRLYDKVLAEDPTDPEALADSGWLEWNYGTQGHSPTLVTQGRSAVEKAVRVAPTYYEARLFMGLILLNADHNATAAVAQFNDFLADHPPDAQVQEVAALVRVAYVAAGVPVPPAFAAPAG